MDYNLTHCQNDITWDPSFPKSITSPSIGSDSWSCRGWFGHDFPTDARTWAIAMSLMTSICPNSNICHLMTSFVRIVHAFRLANPRRVGLVSPTTTLDPKLGRPKFSWNVSWSRSNCSRTRTALNFINIFQSDQSHTPHVSPLHSRHPTFPLGPVSCLNKYAIPQSCDLLVLTSSVSHLPS